jgi:hypothetical protein
MLRRLLAALAARGDSPETEEHAEDAKTPVVSAGAEVAPRLDREYIQRRVKDDLVPLAVECYDSTLESDSELEGRLVMSFSIVGDEDVGGVVDEVVLAEESDLKHEGLTECMRESMYSMTFEPPEGYGSVRVTYPFVFERAK